MKKTLVMAGAVLMIGLVSVAAFFAYVAMVGAEFNEQSQAYVMKTMPVVCSEFDPEAFGKLASPELRKVLPPTEMAKLFKWYSRLGKFKRIVDAKGEANVSIANWSEKSITARYAIKAEFATGHANIEVVLVKREDEWKYLLLMINSPVLLPE